MRFTKDWGEFVRPSGDVIWRPVLSIFVRGVGGLLAADFLEDSGADLCLAPYDLFRELGKEWGEGWPITLRGISRRKVCAMEGRVHTIDLFVAEVGQWFSVPMCFAKGRVPFLLGQEGFFDQFVVTFDKTARRTAFEFREDRS